MGGPKNIAKVINDLPNKGPILKKMVIPLRSLRYEKSSVCICSNQVFDAAYMVTLTLFT